MHLGDFHAGLLKSAIDINEAEASKAEKEGEGMLEAIHLAPNIDPRAELTQNDNDDVTGEEEEEEEEIVN